MTNILVFDLETTDLPKKGVPSDHPTQPHIVQIAALLIDTDTRTEMEVINTLTKPDGWQSSAEAEAIHGISNEKMIAEGIPEKEILAAFCYLQDSAIITVSHNIQFEFQLMRSAMLRYGLTREQADERTHRLNACTMQMATPILNLPPTERMLAYGIRTPKAAKLSECVKHFFDEEHDGAHDALIDARACARVYFHLLANYRFPKVF